LNVKSLQNGTACACTGTARKPIAPMAIVVAPMSVLCLLVIDMSSGPSLEFGALISRVWGRTLIVVAEPDAMYQQSDGNRVFPYGVPYEPPAPSDVSVFVKANRAHRGLTVEKRRSRGRDPP
jgi:hypothetical protein